MQILTFLFGVPLVASLVTFILPAMPRVSTKRFAFALSLLPLAIMLYGWSSLLGEEIDQPWLSALSIHFHLKIDQLSLLFLWLTAIVIPFSILSTPSREIEGPKVYYGLILLLQALLVGFFTSRDLALFTIFWESMLLPLYFIISLWGGPKRHHAALKFLIYMIAGSTLMVAAVLGLYFVHASVQGEGSFNFHALALISENAPYAAVLAAVFFLAFAVKTPLFPFHAWLPEAYTEAPMGGTILLSALLSKAGIYGFLRIGGEIFPNFMQAWGPLFLGLAIAGVFYGAFAAWSQNDYKRLLAYSSFSHVNFVLVGIFVWSQMALSGAILQAVNHGLTITALFLVAGWLQERIGSTSLGQFSGLAKYMPHLCWVTLFFVLSSVALPGLNNFVGEFLIFLGLFARNHWVAAGLVLIIIFSVIYMLRWMEKLYFGEPTPQKPGWKDISARELVTALPLAAIMLWIGFYPTPLLDQYTNPSAEQIIGTAKLELPQ